MERLDGVKKAAVTFDPPEAVVEFDKGRVSLEDMIKAVEEAGFRAKLLSR